MGAGVREIQLRSHVNTNTSLREETRTVHCSRKIFFYIMNKKNEGIRIIFSNRRGNLNQGPTGLHTGLSVI